jgi:transaldolase
VAESSLTFERRVDELPPQPVLDEIETTIDWSAMHARLMEEGVAKFVKPQRALLELIATKRQELAATS